MDKRELASSSSKRSRRRVKTVEVDVIAPTDPSAGSLEQFDVQDGEEIEALHDKGASSVAHDQPSTRLSMRAYAKHRGVTHTSVMMAVRTGRISIGPDGRIDPVLADQEWAMSTDLTKPLNTVTGSPNSGSQRKRTAPVALNFNAARAAHETYKARRAKLEFEQLAGKLVNAEEVRRRWFTAGRRVRDAVMTVADRVAPIVTGMTDASEVHRIIANELRTALEELAVEPNKEV